MRLSHLESSPRREGLPPHVAVHLHDGLREYVRDRLRQHTDDTYAGVPISKFPEDLRVYEHLLWLARADTVIELGAQFGGSTLWFRDRLHCLARYRGTQAVSVIAVDRDVDLTRAHLEAADPGFSSEIELVEGDVADPELPQRIAASLRPGARCFVVEDTAHTYDSTLAALRGFARFVPVGGFMVVEDGCVDVEELRIAESWPRGVAPALRTWLEREGSGFRVRHDLELYGVTCHPGGFLQRMA